MTASLNIGIDAKGGAAAEAELKRVAKGADAIAASEHKAAAAAKARGHAQHEANKFGYKTEHAHGDHGGLMHGLHIAGMAGGEIGHIGHRLGRAGHFGGVGLASAGLGIVGGMMIEGLKEYDERIADVVKESFAIGQKLKEARKSLGEKGLAYAEANGNALRRFGSQGGTYEELQEYQRKGLTVNGLSKIRGLKNWRLTADSAVAGRQFGSDPDSLAEEMSKHGGVRAGSDIIDNAGFYAGRQQGRRIDTRFRGYGRFGEGGYGGDRISEDVDNIDKFNNRGKVGAISQVENGAAGVTALKNMTALLDPMGAVISKAFREGMEQSLLLKDTALKQNSLLALMETILNPLKGDAYKQAKDKEKDVIEAVRNAPKYGAGE